MPRTRAPFVGRASARALVVAVVGVVIATAIAFSSALHGAQLFDDWKAIRYNPSITSLWPPSLLLHPPAGTAVTGRPVVNISLALSYWLTRALGFETSADTIVGYDTFAFHVVNVAIHIACGLLLFGIIRRTLRTGRFGRRWQLLADSAGLLIASLWLLHPLQTEPVDYLIQRTELLVGFFYFATLYSSVRAWDAPSESSRRSWFVTGVVACLLGMGSKEVMCTAPLMVVLYDRAFRLEAWRELGAPTLRSRRWFYGALAASWLLLGMILMDAPRGSTVGFNGPVPWFDYLQSQGWAIPHYLRLALIPVGLTLDYGWAPIVHWRGVPGLVLLAALVVVTLVAWSRSIRWGWLAFLGTWFFVILAPSSSIIPIVTEIAAERRMYLPLAAVLVLLVVAFDRLLRRVVRMSGTPSGRARRRRIVSGVAAVAACAVLGVMTFERGRLYQSPEAIWRDAVTTDSTNARAWYNLGVIVANAPGPRAAEAEGDFRRAVQFDSTYADALIRIAINEMARHEYANAKEHLRLFPLAAGNDTVVANLGAALLAHADTTGALLAMARAAEAPSVAGTLTHYGVLLLAVGRPAGAADVFKRAVTQFPERTDLMLFLGGLLLEQRKPADARGYLAEVIRREPASGVGLALLSVADADLGSRDAAVQEAMHAMELGGNDPHTCFFAGRAMLHAHRDDLADAYLTRAVSLDPQAADPITELGEAEVALGRMKGAIAHFKQALVLNPGDSIARAELGRLHF